MNYGMRLETSSCVGGPTVPGGVSHVIPDFLKVCGFCFCVMAAVPFAVPTVICKCWRLGLLWVGPSVGGAWVLVVVSTGGRESPSRGSPCASVGVLTVVVGASLMVSAPVTFARAGLLVVLGQPSLGRSIDCDRFILPQLPQLLLLRSPLRYLLHWLYCLPPGFGLPCRGSMSQTRRGRA